MMASTRIEFEYTKTHTLEQRIDECNRIRRAYPNRIPVICEKKKGNAIVKCVKSKFLVPRDMNVGQFMYVLRKRIQLQTSEAIFVMCGKTFPSTSTSIEQLYNDHKGEDGYLYMTYSGEDVYG